MVDNTQNSKLKGPMVSIRQIVKIRLAAPINFIIQIAGLSTNAGESYYQHGEGKDAISPLQFPSPKIA